MRLKFLFDDERGQKLVQFLTQGGLMSRGVLIETLSANIPEYHLFKGMEISSMLGRLSNMVDGKH